MDFSWVLLDWKDIAATFWLFLCWAGYTVFSRVRAKKVYCIASVLHHYRIRWMGAMLERDNRITDASLLSNLERNASFLASTSILIIAGLVTSLASIEKVHRMLVALPFSHAQLSPLQLQFKVVVMLCMFVYAFFTFTWAMRQYGFCAVLLGAAPPPEQVESDSESCKNYAYYAAKVIDQAGHSYNYGLRAYYFSIAILAWLLSVWLFVAAVAVVLIVLYCREFHSPTLAALKKGGGFTSTRVRSTRVRSE